MPEAEQQELIKDSQIDGGEDVSHETIEPTETLDLTEKPPEVIEEKVFSKTDVNKMFSNRHMDGLKEQDEIRKLTQENKDLQAKIPQNVRPAIPDMPDQYDEDFAAKQVLREKALVEVAQFDNAQAIADNNAALIQQQTQQAALNALQTARSDYDKRGTDLGLTSARIIADEQKLINAGCNQELGIFLLEEKHGPVVVKYLADNPLEFDALNRMPPMMAAAEIASTIKQKAIDSHKPADPAPDPTDTITSHPGVPEGGKGPKNATYD